jgi:hypothetical protein
MLYWFCTDFTLIYTDLNWFCICSSLIYIDIILILNWFHTDLDWSRLICTDFVYVPAHRPQTKAPAPPLPGIC